MTAELRHGREILVGHNAVESIMRELGIKGLPTRRLPKGARIAKVTSLDLVRRSFRRDRPNELWMTDITEHPTREGKVYCCVVLDAFSRFVVGWSIDSTQTTLLVLNALGMATQRREHGDGLVIHSDRGVQFTSWAFSQQSPRRRPRAIDGSVGSPYDNAMVESFWGRMQVELLQPQTLEDPDRARHARSTTTSSTSTTPAAATQRSACSHQPRPKPNTLTLNNEHQPRQRQPTPATRLHFFRGRSPSP